jgi:hypothetical protein
MEANSDPIVQARDAHLKALVEFLNLYGSGDCGLETFNSAWKKQNVAFGAFRATIEEHSSPA